MLQNSPKSKSEEDPSSKSSSLAVSLVSWCFIIDSISFINLSTSRLTSFRSLQKRGNIIQSEQYHILQILLNKNIGTLIMALIPKRYVFQAYISSLFSKTRKVSTESKSTQSNHLELQATLILIKQSNPIDTLLTQAYISILLSNNIMKEMLVFENTRKLLLDNLIAAFITFLKMRLANFSSACQIIDSLAKET